MSIRFSLRTGCDKLGQPQHVEQRQGKAWWRRCGQVAQTAWARLCGELGDLVRLVARDRVGAGRLLQRQDSSAWVGCGEKELAMKNGLLQG
jgi:hypothetical protein